MTKSIEIPKPRLLQRTLEILAFLAFALSSRLAQSQSPAVTDMLRREFISKDFAVKSFGPIHWIGKGESYTVLEPSGEGVGLNDIVRYDTSTSRRAVLVSASQLVPAGADKPLQIENYAFSEGLNAVLIFTNSRRTW